MSNSIHNNESSHILENPYKDESGNLILPINWYKLHMKNQLERIGKKYIPGLHVEGYADLEIHYMLGHQVLIDNLFLDLEEFSKNAKHIEKIFQKINSYKSLIETFTDELRNLQKHFINLSKKVKMFEKEINIFISLIKGNHFSQSLSFNVLTNFTEEIDQIISILNPLQNSFTKVIENPQKSETQIISVYELVNEIIVKVNKVDFNQKIVLSKIDSFKRDYLIILGEAGMGKTHLISHFINQRLKNEEPALLLLGINFNSYEDLFTQIKNQLEIDNSISNEEFILALENSAKKFHTRILFIIDAINESDDIEIWKFGLKNLLKTLTRTSYIIPVITCRESYTQLIWGNNEIENKEYVLGFGNNQEEALKKYFEYFKLNPQSNSLITDAFNHPLYVRIFCTTYGNPESDEIKIIDSSKFNLYKVFDDFLDRCNDDIIESKMNLSDDKSIVKNALQKISNEIWESGKRYLPKEKARRLIDPKNSWDENLFRAIIEADLLLTRNVIDDEEIVDYTFDLLGDYLIAKNILSNKNENEIKDYFSKSKEFQDLLNNKNRPRRNGILRCLAVMLPLKIKKYLFEFLTSSPIINVISENALFELDNELINNDAINWLKNRFENYDPIDKQRLLKRFLSTYKITNHPLNSNLLNELLFNLKSTERDLTWSELIRKENLLIENILNKFDENLATELDDVNSLDQIHLTAILTAWILSSINKITRDRATKSLFKYGNKFPQQFKDLIKNFLNIDDHYILERLAAATYGITINNPENIHLKESAKDLYNLVFNNDNYYLTSNVFIRDFVKHTLQVILLNDSEYLTSNEIERINPPYISIKEIEWESDKSNRFNSIQNKELLNFISGISYDIFFNNELPSFEETISKINWRVKQLGFDNNKFKEVDNEILSNIKNKVYPDTDIITYYERYVYTAVKELAGYYASKYNVENEFRSFYVRTSYIDIDPTFPKSIENKYFAEFNLLEDDKITTEDWIKENHIPDLKEIYQNKNITDNEEEWILINGYLFQENLQLNRGVMLSYKTALFKSDEINEITKNIKNENPENLFIAEPSNNYTTFAGEFPWCETVSENEQRIIKLVSGYKEENVNIQKVKYFKNDNELSVSEVNKLIFDFQNDNETVSSKNEILDVLNIESKIVNEEVVIKSPVYKNYFTINPVIKFNWESFRSSVNIAQNKITLSKVISGDLNILSKYPFYDLYDKSGNIASINIKFGDKILNSYQLFYLRKDLLNKYLDENSLSMLKITEFKKEYRNDDIELLNEFAFKNKSINKLFEISVYDPTEKSDIENQKNDNKYTSKKKNKGIKKFFNKK